MPCSVELALAIIFPMSFRVDLSYTHYFNSKLRGFSPTGINKITKDQVTPRFSNTTTLSGGVHERHKAQIDSLILNTSFDIYRYNIFKFFSYWGIRGSKNQRKKLIYMVS